MKSFDILYEYRIPTLAQNAKRKKNDTECEENDLKYLALHLVFRISRAFCVISGKVCSRLKMGEFEDGTYWTNKRSVL